jgi:hypothetical protein
MFRESNKLVLGVALIAAVWALSRVNGPADGSWVRPVGAPLGRVRILTFRASVGTLLQGQKAQLCYGVANARSVRISPVSARVDPSMNHCFEIGPQHTTHYTLMAVGFDGSVATRSLTLLVQSLPLEDPVPIDVAELK